MRLVLASWIVAAVFFNAAVQADLVNYGNFSGSQVDFLSVTESSSNIGGGAGQVPHLFGPPSVVGNQLVFLPKFFEAKQTGTGIDLVDSQLSFVLKAKLGYKITGITVNEFGDFSIATPFAGGQGAVSASANAFALTPDGLLVDNFLFTENSVAPPGKLGLPWFGSLGIQFNAADMVTFTMDNTLTAAALTATDASFIKKKGVTIIVHTEPIPEPGAGLMLVVGLGWIAGMRRRNSF